MTRETTVPIGKKEVWTVLGVGMGGKGLLADLGLNGFRLRAYDKDDAQVAGIRKAGGLHVDGRPPGNFAPVELATTEIGPALDGAKVILVSVNGDDHVQVARDLAPHLKDGQIVALIQGHFCGTLVFRKALDDAGCKARVDVCEFDGYPYMMTVRSPDRVELTTDKEMMQVVAMPASRSKHIVDELSLAFRGLKPGPNLLQTGFADLGSVFHACGIVTNVGIAESGQRYNFYAHNMTPSVCNLIEAVDRERVATAKAYGIDLPNVFKWLEITYNRKEPSLTWSLQANAVTHYKYSPAPNSLGHRFLVTDVGSGLVGWSAFAKAAGMKTPAIDSVIGIAGALTKRDFFEEGRSLRNLGLEGKSAAEIKKLITS
jgi:opine dehydrogenase